jgi:hypothetical protein
VNSRADAASPEKKMINGEFPGGIMEFISFGSNPIEDENCCFPEFDLK